MSDYIVKRLRYGCNLQQRDEEQAAKRIEELEAKLAKAVEALREVTQTLVWHCFGSCRGYSDNLLTSKEAEEVARATLKELKG